MCELLVKAIDATHPDPVINLAGCYKRGDVVSIKADNFSWGSGELDKTVFEIVKMPGVPVADMQYLLNANQKPTPLSAMQKIPLIARHINKQLRDNITRKRYSVDIATKQITDKTRG